MILVDVAVPSVDKCYDFNLDENAQIALVIEEMVGMICQKEQCAIVGDKENLLLCRYDGQIILDKKTSLRENGVNNGCKLMLV